MKILILGYGSYDGYLFNSCLDIALELGRKLRGRHRDTLVKILRVSLREVMDFFLNKVQQINPDIIVGLGMYPGARQPILEAAAINIASYKIPDADGVIHDFKKLYNDGELLLTPLFDPLSMINECRKKGHDIIVGLSAGTYLCNALAYNIYRWSRKTGRPGVFFHVPMTTNTLLRNKAVIDEKRYPLVPIVECVESIYCVISKILDRFEKHWSDK